MRRVYQRYNNDCVVAAVAMATGLSYRAVLTMAKAGGFHPGNEGEGIVVPYLLDDLGFDYLEETESFDVHYSEQQEPEIYVVPANDGSPDFHSVIIFKGRCYDPSLCNPVSVSYTVHNATHRYYKIKRPGT